MKDRFNTPLRHMKSFTEPDGYNYQSQMPATYYQHGNTIASFSASVTQNALEMHQWHEMESTVHSQFGTVDNPVLIFTSDSSWRIVICMGPGIEDDAHSHEKIFYMVREGPMNRCLVCGQCFKIVRLRDEQSEEMDYYGMMFSTMSHFDVSEEDMAINLTSVYSDRPQATMQTIPSTNVYVHINADDSDRILVDPAYKLDKLKEAHQQFYAFHQSFVEVEKQMMKQSISFKLPYGRDTYETWVNIEKSIKKFDRLFNRVEKFEARKFSDPDNFQRREKRMLTRKKQRWVENYTYFFGGLTEEEQQYRDYFETDLEEDPEDAYVEDWLDHSELAASGEFDPERFDFIETTLYMEPHENFEDIVEDKIFKYKYRQFADGPESFERRNKRMVDRFAERARTRDPAIEADIADIYMRESRDNSAAQIALDGSKWRPVAYEETAPIREYMLNEGLQQYRDYYETDAEEQKAFEFLDNLDNRGRIRFMEVFEDYTISKHDRKEYAMIQKREFNPELSAVSNLILDLVDFRDRVRPIANDLALMDISHKHQRYSVEEIERERAELIGDLDLSRRSAKDEAGYSSGEISDRSGSAVPQEEPVAAQQAAEPEQPKEIEHSEAEQEEPVSAMQEEPIAVVHEEPIAVVHEEPSY